MIPGSANPLLLTSAAAGPAPSTEYSVRFNSADSAYLSRTPSSAGNRKTWTWSGWVKRSSFGEQMLFFRYPSTGSGAGISFGSDDTLSLSNFTSSVLDYIITTTAVYRDPSAWYHIVATVDTTQATADNRLRLYINGVEITDFSSRTNPSQNFEGYVNDAALHTIARREYSAAYAYFDGYLANIHFIDGQALTPSSFGFTDSNGVWQPKAFSGSYGTNGFHLDFADNSSAAALGNDVSGNNNDWTVNNISVTAGSGNDSLVDFPTNGSQTDTGVGGEVRGNYATLNPLDAGVTGLSNGNLDAASANAYPTIIPGSGQWYYEVNGTGYTWDGTRANWTPRAGSHNFGQRVWASSAPSGYKALCTANLPTPAVADGSTAMDVALYTGTGTAQSISTPNLSPDLVWLKIRNTTGSHGLWDSVRGTSSRLVSNSTGSEDTTVGVTALSSNGFTVDGPYNTASNNWVAWTWDAGSSTVSNTDGTITSQVRANPTAGISVVSYTGTGANATIGHGLNAAGAPEMIIVKNRDAALNWNVYHVGTNASTPEQYFLRLNTTDAAISASVKWNNTSPTSSVFSVGTSGNTNSSGANLIAYCFAPVEGFSAFGSYTGNGSADGPFIYTGFKPKWIMTKASSGGGSVPDWLIFDSVRDSYNVGDKNLSANGAAQEQYYSTNILRPTDIDILSNGFKLRQFREASNRIGSTYIYAAFAEHPFNTSRAR